MRIAIIGASSQVGSSLSYYLKLEGVDVVCFTRSSYSDIFFKVLGIHCEHINLSDRDDVREKLKNFDGVVDFGYPTGQLFSIKKSIRENLKIILSCMPQKAKFFYMSSITAYGMPLGQKYIRNYLIPRSSYAYLKRFAEKIVRHTGSKLGINAYNFRLGQVHGILQSVNTSFRSKLNTNFAKVDGRPDELTNTIFVGAICEGILKCINENIKPGTYTLVSTPQWTLEELYGYYIDYYNLPINLAYLPSSPHGKTRSFAKNLFGYFKRYRSLLEIYILMNVPSIAVKLKGKFRISQVKAEVIADRNAFIDFNLLGTPSGELLYLNSSRVETIKEAEIKFDRYYQNELMKNRK